MNPTTTRKAGSTASRPTIRSRRRMPPGLRGGRAAPVDAAAAASTDAVSDGGGHWFAISACTTPAAGRLHPAGVMVPRNTPGVQAVEQVDRRLRHDAVEGEDDAIGGLGELLELLAQQRVLDLDGSPSTWFEPWVWYSSTKMSWFSGSARNWRNSPASSFFSLYSVTEIAISGPPARHLRELRALERRDEERTHAVFAERLEHVVVLPAADEVVGARAVHEPRRGVAVRHLAGVGVGEATRAPVGERLVRGDHGRVIHRDLTRVHLR